jgi:hypothetical protein
VEKLLGSIAELNCGISFLLFETNLTLFSVFVDLPGILSYSCKGNKSWYTPHPSELVSIQQLSWLSFPFQQILEVHLLINNTVKTGLNPLNFEPFASARCELFDAIAWTERVLGWLALLVLT